MASTNHNTGLREAVWAKILFSSIGCLVAGTTTNPIDVIKIRLQLQGELAAHPMAGRTNNATCLDCANRWCHLSHANLGAQAS